MIFHFIKKLFITSGNLVLIVLLICVALLMVGCRQDDRAEKAFEEIIGHSSTVGIALKTDRATYKEGDDIIFWAENRTDQDLWFVNGNFGVRGYSYDRADGRWKEVDLGNRIINPHPWKVPAHHLLYGTLGNLDTNFFAKFGRIRLIVQGCVSPERVTENCADYVAYRDVTVNPRR